MFNTTRMNATAFATQQTSTSNLLVDSVDQAFIIAYKEPTQLLEKVLTEEGFNCEVLRQEVKAEDTK